MIGAVKTDTRLQWFGSVPEHWKVARNKNVFRVVSKTVGERFAEFDLLSLTLQGVKLRDIESGKGKFPASFETYQEVEPGDIVFCLFDIDETPRTVGLSQHKGMVTGAYTVVRCSSLADPRYVTYFYLSIDQRKGLRPFYTGLRKVVRTETLLNAPFPLPERADQKAIADFLDRETARIDQLIEKKRRLLEVLRERLLSELERLTAATKPLHSELVPFRWVCRITEGQVDPTAPVWAGKPLIAPNHIESRTGRLTSIETAEEQGAISGKYSFPAGTVIYSKIRPNLAKACVSPVAGMCSADMYPILPNKSLRPMFLLMQLLSKKFTDWATLESMRVAMPKINRETLGAYRVWVPDLSVQDEAIERFFAEQEIVEQLSDKVRESMAQMREFRSALITAAVTGQIDVGAWGKQGQTDRRLERIEEAMSA